MHTVFFWPILKKLAGHLFYLAGNKEKAGKIK